ncbi:hypothetical protein [Herbaspirillum sp. ST 5-3]|uniref:hypothetical protein n=1 Tax=Oxalobacteraceae TaxID=75682 RepID=UPI0010A2DBC6|nr:hypothetical protein [Herbaspirillum sp. ST 5-3]
MWDGVKSLIGEIQLCEKVGATAASIAMAFICIDTMTRLSLPADRETQTRADFIDWVEKYLVAHPDQPYQYRGVDVYGARCSVLHTFASVAQFHENNPDVKWFAYHDGGEHKYDPAVSAHLVMIGTASFLNDVIHAVQTFMQACMADGELRQRVETRLPQLLNTIPFKQ